MKKKLIKCVAFILKNNNEILIEKRREDKRTDPGLYCIPSGGIEESESRRDAVQREIKEELSLEVNSQSYLGSLIYEKEEVDFEIFYFLITKWSGEIKSQEADLLEWREIKESSVDTWPDKVIINLLKQKEL